MTKLPYIALYVNDWGRDLEEHPLEIEGAWLRIVCKLWWEGGSGFAIKSHEAWSKILRISEEKTTEILKYIKDKNIGNIRFSENGDGKPMAEVICRRMERDWKLRKDRSKAGLKGAESRWQIGGKKKKMAKHMAKVWQNTDNDNDNDNDNDINIKKNLNNTTTPIFDKWNSFAEAHGLTKITEIEKGSQREVHLRTIAKKKGFNFDSLLEIIGRSPFLLGEVEPKIGGKRFFATFDWIINKTNYQKVIEGNYVERIPAPREDRFLKYMNEQDDLKKKAQGNDHE